MLTALGWYIKHWSECGDLEGRVSVTEQEAADSRLAPSLLRPLYCSMFHNLTFSGTKMGGGNNLVPALPYKKAAKA